MSKNFILALTLLLAVVFSSHVLAFTEIVNPQELKKRLGNISPTKAISEIKVAVLDNGFSGFIPGSGMLPDSAELVEGSLKFPTSTSHGLGMAQILWAVTGKTSAGPKFYLVNTNGFTNFKSAVDFVIQERVDIVLYSQVWLFGSNFDGKGFINEVVNRATDSGIIWINAAGNLGGHVYQGKIEDKKTVFAFNNRLDENHFTVTLTWNDFRQSEAVCATKDMDLEIINAKGEVVQTSNLVQEGRGPDPKVTNDKYSCYARESINVKSLDRGIYRIRVARKSLNFESSDIFRVIISDEKQDSLVFTDHSVGHEIMPPADNAQVITVGDRLKLSSIGPTIDDRIKPDFLVDNSSVMFTNGNETKGSSNAAALVAGAVAIMKSHNRDLTWQKLLAYSESLRINYGVSPGLTSAKMVPPAIQDELPETAVVMRQPSTGRVVVFTRQESLSLSIFTDLELKKMNEDDVIACLLDLSRCEIFSKEAGNQLKYPWVEFRQFTQTVKTSKPSWVTKLL